MCNFSCIIIETNFLQKKKKKYICYISSYKNYMNEYKTHNCIFCQTYSFKYVRIYIKKVCYILIENSITVDYWANNFN